MSVSHLVLAGARSLLRRRVMRRVQPASRSHGPRPSRRVIAHGRGKLGAPREANRPGHPARVPRSRREFTGTRGKNRTYRSSRLNVFPATVRGIWVRNSTACGTWVAGRRSRQ